MQQLSLPLAKKKVRRRRKRVGVDVGRSGGRGGLAVASREKREKREKKAVPHRTRAAHDFRHPVHVTIARVPRAPSFRAQVTSRAIRHEIAFAKSKGIRVIEDSIQADHLHLIVEGQDAGDLSSQMRTLFSRIAMAVNRVSRRHGSLFRDRHHRHALKTPREVRNALVYVLFNSRKHGAGPAAEEQAFFDAPDPLSSAPWFRDWDPNARPPPDAVVASQGGLTESPFARAETWLARVGWKRAGGLIRFDEQPRKRL